MNLERPKSFFLFAGAGSGKTRTLVEVLKRFKEENSNQLRKTGQQVAVITYTNAACEEIKERLEFDYIFKISTIHSFSWELIKPFTSDIKQWLETKINSQLADLQEQQNKAKNRTTQTFLNRNNQIKRNSERRLQLDNIKSFTYSPNGDATSYNSLSHTEVIEIATTFIKEKRTMQRILIQKYPFLFIDESQDTKKELLKALFELQKNHAEMFSLGLFGDTMQRIYNDGMENLGDEIPEGWLKPAKILNHRCPKRVITLINKIRSYSDNQEQIAVKRKEGVVRLFIADSNSNADKTVIEDQVISKMTKITGDAAWEGKQEEVKILILEHHMAAKRGGFSNFFNPLYKQEKLKTDLLNGALTGISLLSEQVLELIKAKKCQDHFRAAHIVRTYSPLISKKSLKESQDSIGEIRKANEAVKNLCNLWDEGASPLIIDVIKELSKSGLFEVPDLFQSILDESVESSESRYVDNKEKSVMLAWDDALNCPFEEFEKYADYINDSSRYGTHQGIKGLQFPRVMLIIDDDEARGFLFSYEKLFGAKEPSKQDLDNAKEGKESGVEHTRRLFYVGCSRTEESLAIVAHTRDPEKVRNNLLKMEWFEENEIINL